MELYVFRLFSFINFQMTYINIILYLIVINVATFIIFALDKYNAINKKRRVRIITLLELCIIGGSLGGLLSMKIFHHKTNKKYFTIGIPLIILTQFIFFFFIMNYK